MTLTFLVVVILVVIAWDVWVALTPSPGDTVSESAVYTAQHSAGAVLIIGVCLGHMLWPQVVYVEPRDGSAASDALRKRP